MIALIKRQPNKIKWKKKHILSIHTHTHTQTKYIYIYTGTSNIYHVTEIIYLDFHEISQNMHTKPTGDREWIK